VELDLRPEKLGHKIREAALEKIPYMAVLGPKDAAAGVVSLRLASGKQVVLSAEELAAKLSEEARGRLLASPLA
ncbi:MAG: His/Gly/Thr/Pro-type tRNA ligase C-terminal domain-containing protein, partial [Elusimicrobiota bacterium]